MTPTTPHANTSHHKQPLDRLTDYAQEWQVKVEKTFETETSVMGFGIRDAVQVVLKISKHPSDEWHSGDILRAFEGNGIVRVFEFDAGAVLLERLAPGNNLVSMVREGKDDEATRILAGVMQQLANHASPDGCPTVFDWAGGFSRYLNSADEQIPADFVHEAQELYLRLAQSSSRPMLLHGDLHHYNLLSDRERGWVAIDPKGVVGELEYEVGAILRNPIELPDCLTNPEVIQARLRILSAALHLDHQRALQWSFAQAVLSAIWTVDDDHFLKPDHPTLRLANTLRAMLR